MSIFLSIEDFGGVSDLLGTQYRHIHPPLDSAKNILFGGELRKMVFCKKYFKCFEKKYDLVLSILSK